MHKGKQAMFEHLVYNNHLPFTQIASSIFEVWKQNVDN
jgi:hypothetical protein